MQLAIRLGIFLALGMILALAALPVTASDGISANAITLVQIAALSVSLHYRPGNNHGMDGVFLIRIAADSKFSQVKG